MLEHDGTPSATSLAATKSAEIRLYTAAVLRHLPEKPLQPVPMGQVFLATDGLARNRLSNISTRCAGLVTDDGTVSDLPFGSFQDRTVYVIDVASLEEDAQDLIFARVVTKLREHLEKRDLRVNHVVVFVDELNKYAPSDGQDIYGPLDGATSAFHPTDFCALSAAGDHARA